VKRRSFLATVPLALLGPEEPITVFKSRALGPTMTLGPAYSVIARAASAVLAEQYRIFRAERGLRPGPPKQEVLRSMLQEVARLSGVESVALSTKEPTT
jgi:hypothetical protein